MNTGLPSLAILGVIVFAIAVLIWSFYRSKQLLESWACDNDFQIVSFEYRYFFKGPFFWTSSNHQAVYYVTVTTADGETRNGWVRCGGWLLGMLSDQVDVEWDQ